MAEPTTDQPIFYWLKARYLEEGMTTADGQDLLDISGSMVIGSRSQLIAHVYTPADVPEEDEENRRGPEARIYDPEEWVQMADFVNTPNPGSAHEHARPSSRGDYLPPGDSSEFGPTKQEKGVE